MTKPELLNGLNNILNNFLYGLMCSRLVPRETWRGISTGATLFEGPEVDIRISLGPISQRLTDSEMRKGFIRNYENSLLRTVLRETHELILLYCEETHQFKLYKTEPWFQFVRVLRNIVSHKQGGILREWPRDLQNKGIANVSWRNRILDTTMLGKHVSFYHNEALQLLKDLHNFAESKLT